MVEQTSEVPRERRKGDRRGGGRRSGDAFVIGRPTRLQMIAGAMAVVLLIIIVRTFGGDDDTEGTLASIPVTPAPEEPAVLASHPSAAIREVYTIPEFEALLAEGDGAVGQTIRTELFCGSISQVTVRSVVPMNPSISALSGSDGRVAAAECRWNRESLAAELLLVVPPGLAEDFARTPEVEINFVTRRRVPAEIEWLGRSGELALRNAAILRLIII